MGFPSLNFKTMPTSDELLRQAKEQERIEVIERVRERIRNAEKSVGKCHATHTLKRKSYRNIEATVEKIIGVTLNNYEYKFHKMPLEGLTTDVLKSVEVEYVKETITYIVQCEGDRRVYLHVGINYEKVNGHKWFRYEITPMEFENIKDNALLRVTDIGRDIRRELPKWNMLITHGEDSADNNKVSLLEDTGFTLFELPTEEMTYLLGWHPFLYGKKILKTKESVELIKKRCEEIQDSINRMYALPYGSKTIERDRETLNILKYAVELLSE